MSRTGLNAEIRDTKEGTVYPAPIAEFPVLTGFGAGYPDYPWFFGTDGAYSTFGLAVTGQCDAAMNHLDLVRSVSQNGSQYTTTVSAPTG
jgi:glycogen debranching enzyme